MKKILYVEDDMINALVMTKLLKPSYEVVHVHDGESCMEKLKQDRFDMILMDINLGRGKIDGTEAMKLIKAHNNAIPVLAVTSYAMPEDEGRFLNQGFDGYVVKPIDRKDLLEYISRFFQ
jgi:two-component system, cell cycle response regulator DivK